MRWACRQRGTASRHGANPQYLAARHVHGTLRGPRRQGGPRSTPPPPVALPSKTRQPVLSPRRSHNVRDPSVTACGGSFGMTAGASSLGAYLLLRFFQLSRHRHGEAGRIDVAAHRPRTTAVGVARIRSGRVSISPRGSPCRARRASSRATPEGVARATRYDPAIAARSSASSASSGPSASSRRSPRAPSHRLLEIGGRHRERGRPRPVHQRGAEEPRHHAVGQPLLVPQPPPQPRREGRLPEHGVAEQRRR